MSDPRELASIAERLRHLFADPRLLERALTHKSYTNEQPGEVLHNERLEFLGDAVLDLAVSEDLIRSHPRLPEGELTRIRAEVVSEPGLATLARDLDLGAYLRLGRGEARSGGADKDSVLADGLEALLGAVFLDGGYEAARGVIERLFGPAIAAASQRKGSLDHKTRLQELCQARFGTAPFYRLLGSEGPAHDPIYRVEALLGERVIGSGSGRNKKGAEQEAARAALEGLEPPG